MKDFKLFLEKATPPATHSNKNLVKELTISMLLLNEGFLDRILDMGLKARYTENSRVFVNDLKNLLLKKNRLKLGKFVEGRCQEDPDLGKINSLFEGVGFSMEEEFNLLVKCRSIARNITDKILAPEKLEPAMIKSVFWLGPNKTPDFPEDIVIELEDSKQLSLLLDKSFSQKKSSSFQKFTDELIPQQTSDLFSPDYMSGWDKLVRNMMRILFKWATSDTKALLSKFISEDRIDDLTFFKYFNINHPDKRFQFLGEHILQFDKNVKKLSELVNLIWKNKDKCLTDSQKACDDWCNVRIFLLNSRILEHTLTQSLIKHNPKDIVKLKSNMKLAKGLAKMKFVKTIVEKLGSTQRDMYFSTTDELFYLPERKFFRDNFSSLDILFDYHQKLKVEPLDEDNDFKILIKLYLDKKILLTLNIDVGFSGMISEKLTAKFKFTPISNFAYRIKNKTQKED